MVAQRQGGAGSVAALGRDSLTLLRELGSRSIQTGHCYESLAWAASVRGEPEQAARLLGAAEPLREDIGAQPAR